MSTTLQDATRVERDDDLVGKTIGKYDVRGVVGRGGMGCVYEAVNPTISKTVALKVIDHELAKNDEASARFQREAFAASAVDNPHIVQIFDAGTHEGTPFIVMELLRGRDLGVHLGEHRTLGVDETLAVTAQILKALRSAHAAGIVHRDLKPDNVFLTDREDEPVFVKLLDFGVSKIARDTDVPLKTLTRQGTVVGTPFYMSPEQAQAFPDVDGRTDLYSVGAIMYECLTGQPPHEGKSYEQVIVNICMKDVPDVRDRAPQVPPEVATIVQRALARERDERFADAREMLQALIDAAPESIGLSNSGGHARVAVPSSGGSRKSHPTARQIISAPQSKPANELAETMQVSSEPDPPDDAPPPRPSGADTVADASRVSSSGPFEVVDEPSEVPAPGRPSEAASTVRSPDPDEALPSRDPRRNLMLGALAALLVFGGVLAWQGGSDAPPAPPAAIAEPELDGGDVAQEAPPPPLDTSEALAGDLDEAPAHAPSAAPEASSRSPAPRPPPVARPKPVVVASPTVRKPDPVATAKPAPKPAPPSEPELQLQVK